MNKNKIKVCGVERELSTGYMYGDISILYIDDQNTGVFLWGVDSENELDTVISDGVESIYGAGIKWEWVTE